MEDTKTIDFYYHVPWINELICRKENENIVLEKLNIDMVHT